MLGVQIPAVQPKALPRTGAGVPALPVVAIGLSLLVVGVLLTALAGRRVRRTAM